MREAQRLLREGKLDDEQLGALDFKALSWFWGSEVGKLIRDQNQFVHRELAFTARFSAAELALILGHPHDPSLDGEFVLVQGVADLAVVAPKEIWLLDFKTDQVNQQEVATQGRIYQSQINLYATALSRIYRRPVTKSYLCFLKAREAVVVKTV
jgi:ATP-dependent helicase/nuclease subunit A